MIVRRLILIGLAQIGSGYPWKTVIWMITEPSRASNLGAW